MQPLPSADIRSNRGTWIVPVHALPALGNWMHDVLPNEPYDPHFHGQQLETTYLDTADFSLRKARLKKEQYLTLRVRCYDNGAKEVYALSAKTESQKFRQEIPNDVAHVLLGGNALVLDSLLPPDLLARLLELAAEAPVVPVVTVCCRRYAVEDKQDRYTLDAHVHTNHGKSLPFGVLEFKSVQNDPPPGSLQGLGLQPLKLSKFLWATEV